MNRAKSKPRYSYWLNGPARLKFALFVVAIGDLVACHRSEQTKERGDGAAQSSALVALPSSKSSNPVAKSAASPEPEPPWARLDKSRCAFDLEPLRSANALFATSRQLRDRADLDALVLKGIAGAPERLALRVEGTYGARCECEPFHSWFSASDTSFTPIINIENKGVPQVGFGTALSFILIGYFSGAHINIYEQRRVQGVKPREPDEEERPIWPKREPEFCIEALCYWPPAPAADSELEKLDHRARFLRMVGTKHVKHMDERGVPRCKAEWRSRSPHR